MASYFSCTIGEEQQFRVALSKGGLTKELVQVVGNDSNLGRVMVEALKAELAKNDEPAIVTFNAVPVDYAIRPTDDFSKLFDLVSDGYVKATNWQRDKSCRDVSTKGQAELTFELVHFNKIMATKDVLEVLDSISLRPATLEELVSFSLKHPELQREFWIAGLGSYCHWPSDRSVPILRRTGDKRALSLDWGDLGDSWRKDDHFLAVHKTEETAA